jgi:hypothetical protein
VNSKAEALGPAFAGTTRLCAVLLLPLLLLPGPSRPRRGRGGNSPKGRAHDARAFAVRPRMACQRTSVAPSRSRRLLRRPRPRGCPLLAYFLWASRESRSLARMASEASQGCESVFAARPRIPDAQEQKPDKNENDEPHRPHPALSRKREREKHVLRRKLILPRGEERNITTSSLRRAG